MSSALLITLDGLHVGELSATEQACNRRDALLLQASKFRTIQDAAGAQNVGQMMRDLKEFANSIEASRVEVSAPILARAKAINELAAHLKSDIEIEVKRLNPLLGGWQQRQREIEQEAKQKAWEEEKRIRDEAARLEQAEADRIEREAQAQRDEAARLVKEAQDKAARARTASGKAKAEKEAQEAQERADAAAKLAAAKALEAEKARQDQLAQKIIDTRSSVAAAVPGKVAGIATRWEYKYEVTDLAALYEANPFFVKLTPNDSAIKSALKQLRDDQKIPGLTWRKEAAVSVR